MTFEDPEQPLDPDNQDGELPADLTPVSDDELGDTANEPIDEPPAEGDNE